MLGDRETEEWSAVEGVHYDNPLPTRFVARYQATTITNAHTCKLSSSFVVVCHHPNLIPHNCMFYILHDAQ